MQSESARMSSAHEAAYRIPYPNSKQRAAKIIALDAPSAQLLDAVAQQDWRGARFFTSLAFAPEETPGATTGGLHAWLGDLAGRTLDLVEEVAHADYVVCVTSAGEDARAVSVIADACRAHSKTLIGLVMPHEGASEAEIAASLDHLRPHARMLVVASGADYIETMLMALRA